MTSKSHVSLATNICVVCGKEYETGELLLDRHMKQSLNRHTYTGYEMCKEHQSLVDKGYIHLVVIKNDENRKRFKPEEADRTGEVISIKREVASQFFSVDIDSDMLFIDESLADYMKEIQCEAS